MLCTSCALAVQSQYYPLLERRVWKSVNELLYHSLHYKKVRIDRDYVHKARNEVLLKEFGVGRGIVLEINYYETS